MSNETDHLRESVDVYAATIARIEQDIHMIDAGAFYASAAISLKRIADALENSKRVDDVREAVAGIEGKLMEASPSIADMELLAMNMDMDAWKEEGMSFPSFSIRRDRARRRAYGFIREHEEFLKIEAETSVTGG